MFLKLIRHWCNCNFYFLRISFSSYALCVIWPNRASVTCILESALDFAVSVLQLKTRPENLLLLLVPCVHRGSGGHDHCHGGVQAPPARPAIPCASMHRCAASGRRGQRRPAQDACVSMCCCRWRSLVREWNQRDWK